MSAVFCETKILEIIISKRLCLINSSFNERREMDFSDDSSRGSSSKSSSKSNRNGSEKGASSSKNLIAKKSCTVTSEQIEQFCAVTGNNRAALYVCISTNFYNNLIYVQGVLKRLLATSLKHVTET